MLSHPRYLSGCALVAAALVGATACGSSDNSVGVQVASNLTVNASSLGLTGIAGLALATPVSVHATDENGNAVANATVDWAVTAGGGSVSAASTETDASGNASVFWTLGAIAGVDSLKASLESGASARIGAVATNGTASALVKVSGNNQAIASGSVSAPMVVEATDALGNAVAGVVVTWSVQGGGTLSATSTTTDANGHAQVALTLGATPATYIVTAASGSMSTTFTIVGQ